MTLLRIEVHAPAEHAGTVEQLLLDASHAINVTRQRGVLVDPVGDVLACDLPRECADELVERLAAGGFCAAGSSVAVVTGLTHLSQRATEVERAARGSGADALIWRQLVDTLDEEVDPSVSYLLFMVLATLLGAIGVVTNSAILVVGAMVIGPEFGPLANTFVAVLDRDVRRIVRGAATLVVGFAAAIVATTLFAAAMRGAGVFPDELRFVGFVAEVATVSWLSLVIALIAGVAGTLALTSNRSGSLIGVLISVTTIPAAADAAVLLSYDRAPAALDALLTLAVNLVGMTVAGVVTLAAHRRLVRLRA